MIVTFNDEEEVTILYYASHMNIDGVSRLRERKERIANLEEDQITGCLGEAALHKYLFRSIHLWIEIRKERDKNPHQGDGGFDVDLNGRKIDVKASRMRVGARHRYHLWVRPHEWHPDTQYYLALVPTDRTDTVYLIGWIMGRAMRLKDGRYEATWNELKPVIVDGKAERKPY